MHYGTLTDAAAYHAARGQSDWSTGSDGARTAALIRASTALDGRYGARFGGVKTGGRTQELAWPRIGAFDACAGEEIAADTVPVEIERATYELALVEFLNPGALSPSVTPGRVTKREKVEGIEREFMTGSDGWAAGSLSLRPVFPVVDDLLRCVLTSTGAGASVEILRV